jgi:hypothetical protein
MILLYHYATSLNGLVVGTGNKIEDYGVGFFTKYGDGGYTFTKGSPRTPKNNIVIKVIGELDELNSHIGFLISSVSFLTLNKYNMFDFLKNNTYS